MATLWEAAVGLSDREAAERWRAEAESTASAAWMIDGTRTQIGRLEKLLEASPLRT